MIHAGLCSLMSQDLKKPTSLVCPWVSISPKCMRAKFDIRDKLLKTVSNPFVGNFLWLGNLYSSLNLGRQNGNGGATVVGAARMSGADGEKSELNRLQQQQQIQMKPEAFLALDVD
ncbi:hypothetical protein M9H77_27182 [Catharanthus roseus]|uniref:Uncharacterized protein n=1 Tax=Catharanthus roseus TaxID=4058 RepID=A0ACC0AC72_CATRO|nr:hypothetical protein M9H77_27182 [Catharanthus roseus]